MYQEDVRHAHAEGSQGSKLCLWNWGDFLTLQKGESTKTESPALENLFSAALLGGFDSAAS